MLVSDYWLHLSNVSVLAGYVLLPPPSHWVLFVVVLSLAISGGHRLMESKAFPRGGSPSGRSGLRLSRLAFGIGMFSLCLSIFSVACNGFMAICAVAGWEPYAVWLRGYFLAMVSAGGAGVFVGMVACAQYLLLRAIAKSAPARPSEEAKS